MGADRTQEDAIHTLVMFVETDPQTAPSGRWKNRLYTRSMRKMAFIDNRYPKDGAYPQAGEYWLVEIIRENQNAKGGCFIIRPIHRVEVKDHSPLVIGMYDLNVLDSDTVIVTPKETGKFWVMSPDAKRSILASTGAKAIVINHGGSPTWPRRKPAEDVLEHEARRLLEET